MIGKYSLPIRKRSEWRDQGNPPHPDSGFVLVRAKNPYGDESVGIGRTAWKYGRNGVRWKLTEYGLDPLDGVEITGWRRLPGVKR